MCGIAGVVSSRPLNEPERLIADRMSDALRHRGPNGEGKYRAERLNLVMRRLSIIDLDGGWQPLYNEDRSLAIIANGEIYNYVELQQELKARGHHFQTGSDIETILHLYEECGRDCIQQLRGMYAFALWDEPKQQLLLGRDRMGEKPLYLWEHDQTLIFASELRALLAALPHRPELDPVCVDLYFHYGYVPEPYTPLLGIRKLPAGHILSIDVLPWRLEQRCYWDMLDAPPLQGDPVEAIRDELDTISSIIIRSDVPVGVALSGGIDSSALATLAARKYPGTMQAFSVGYPGQPANDERADAKRLADHLGLPFHDIELKTDDMVRFFPDLVYSTDDPIADIAGYGYYSVSRLAREHGVPVLLQGQGGDELFWGYGWVQEAVCDTLVKQHLNDGLNGQHVLDRWLTTLPFRVPPMPKSFPGHPRHLKKWARQWRDSYRTKVSRWQRINEPFPDTLVFMDYTLHFNKVPPLAQDFYVPSILAQIPERNAYSLFTYPQPWQDVPAMLTRLISQTYLLENGIAQGDRLSMASSVELRLPLVDYRLAEIVIGHRKAISDHSLPPKTWLRQALQGILPDWLMNRPKRGFTPPHEWFAALFKAYGSQVGDGYLVQSGIANPKTAPGWFTGDKVRGYPTNFLYRILCLEVWCRKVLGGEVATRS